MAIQTNIGELKVDLPGLEAFTLQEPVWLLLALLPVTALLAIWRKSPVADLDFANPAVLDASVAIHRRWPKHCISLLSIIGMLSLVYPATRPIISTTQETEKALLIWVYDVSLSMETEDVTSSEGATVSRIDASVAALKDSLADIQSDYYKLFVSFAEAENVFVGNISSSNKTLLEHVQDVEMGQYTHTDAGLEKAFHACRQFFNDQEDSPCQVFLLSDGSCNPRPQCLSRSLELTAKAAESGIVVHAVSWGDPRSDFKPNAADMAAIADAGNGEHLASVSAGELANLYRQAATRQEVTLVHQALGDAFVWGSRIILMSWALAFCLRRWE